MPTASWDRTWRALLVASMAVGGPPPLLRRAAGTLRDLLCQLPIQLDPATARVGWGPRWWAGAARVVHHAASTLYCLRRRSGGARAPVTRRRAIWGDSNAKTPLSCGWKASLAALQGGQRVRYAARGRQERLCECVAG